MSNYRSTKPEKRTHEEFLRSQSMLATKDSPVVSHESKKRRLNTTITPSTPHTLVPASSRYANAEAHSRGRDYPKPFVRTSTPINIPFSGLSHMGPTSASTVTASNSYSTAPYRGTPAASPVSAATIRGITDDLKHSSSLNSADLKKPLPGKKKNYIIRTFSDLPEEYQKHVLKAGISRDEANRNLEVVLNILHFKTKCDFHTPEQLERKSIKVRRYNTGESHIANGIVSTKDLQDEAVELLENEYLKKDYKTLHQAGKGGFGKVYLAKSFLDSGSHVAVKRMPHITLKQQRKNFQEIRFLKYCEPSVNIVKYYRSYLVKDEIWLVTEFMQGGTLTQAVSNHRFTESEIAYVAKQILLALDYLHNNQLAHRDLKSANIMLSLNGTVKIIDFGLCSDISQGEVVHMVGSPFWMPPEMIKREPHGLSVDVWSFAICMMEVANGHPPNRKSSIKAMFTAGTVGYPNPLERPELWSPKLLDFLTGCLKVNPNSRYSVKQLLAHPFIQSASSVAHMSELFHKIFTANQSPSSDN